jgi:hypothetical protein
MTWIVQIGDLGVSDMVADWLPVYPPFSMEAELDGIFRGICQPWYCTCVRAVSYYTAEGKVG